MSTETKDRAPAAGDIFHVELQSADAGATRKFMEAVFGWRFTATPHPDFHLIETPGGGEGHIGPIADAGGAPSLTSYLLVEDLDAAAAAIQGNGGEIVQPRAEAPGQGSYLWFRAPGGETMVAWEHASE